MSTPSDDKLFDRVKLRHPAFAQATREHSTQYEVDATQTSDGAQQHTTITIEERRSEQLQNDRLMEEVAQLHVENKRRKQENRLRWWLAKRMVLFVAIQLAIFNVLVIAYLTVQLCRNNPIPSEVLIGWLTSSLVEILGIVWVIARSIFPFNDKNRDKENERIQALTRK